MDDRCVKHAFEAAEGICRHCGDAFCPECLVYSFGPKQPPFCVSCALAAAGVRSNAARKPSLSKRELRKREKALAKARKGRPENAPAAEAGEPEVVADLTEAWPTDDESESTIVFEPDPTFSQPTAPSRQRISF